MSDPENKPTADRLEISSATGDVVANYQFGTAVSKPFVHPLVTPAGAVLTALEPADHVWHRGLWYTIKFINGTNFWEEHPPFGVQVSRAKPTKETTAPGLTRIQHELEWRSDATGPVLHESRTILFRAADADGVGVIDWSTSLHALQDLKLDRTPYTTWGGYGGLTFRGSSELRDVTYETPDGARPQGIAGERHDWVILRATAGQGTGRRVSFAMVDHPSNPRSPSPWYCRGNPGYTFFNAAFLFHELMVVKAGKSLKFRYRLAYRDGEWTNDAFARWAESFRKE